jgi:hypothetical protein
LPSIAIESYLVDEQPAAVPSGFDVLRATFNEGVPRELALSDGWSVILYAPTGMARAWLDGDPAEIVSSSEHERIPHSATVANTGDLAARLAARLVIRRGGAPLGALPLASGVMGRFHASSAMLELMPLAWEIRSGAMRGGAPSSARIELAWRSRLLKAGLVTGSAGGGGGGGGSGGGSAPEESHRVVVTREDPSGRNQEFIDLVNHRTMTREQFVSEIRAGTYPDYEVRTFRGIATPVSKRTTTPDDNLG